MTEKEDKDYAENPENFADDAKKCREHGGLFDDNPGKDICKTCEDWLVETTDIGGEG